MRCVLPIVLMLSAAACQQPDAPPPVTPLAEAETDVIIGDMIYVPGGVTLIGSEEGEAIEQPVFAAEVASFWLDASPVTVARFRAFVGRTGYETEAERFGNAGVLVDGTWRLVDGADWRTPQGPGLPLAPDDHPVTQVSWHDAVTFCAAEGKRLPTELEWEHAARGARDGRSRYAWGDALNEGGRTRANTWEGTFPVRNTAADGYAFTSPVGAFGATDLGLTDMGGNVWEWTDSWFRPYPDRDAPFTPTAASVRVQRGGSFLCNPGWCHGYRVSARGHATPETSLFHVGFRCAQDRPGGER
jgi:sulfatase modifying factor 1